MLRRLIAPRGRRGTCRSVGVGVGGGGGGGCSCSWPAPLWKVRARPAVWRGWGGGVDGPAVGRGGQPWALVPARRAFVARGLPGCRAFVCALPLFADAQPFCFCFMSAWCVCVSFVGDALPSRSPRLRTWCARLTARAGRSVYDLRADWRSNVLYVPPTAGTTGGGRTPPSWRSGVPPPRCGPPRRHLTRAFPASRPPPRLTRLPLPLWTLA